MFELILGEEAQLKFAVNIAGTSARPAEVRGLIGNQLKMCIAATPVNDKEYLFTFPVLKEFFTVGPTQLQIEIHLNGRVFVPVKRDIMIINSAEEVNGEVEKYIEPTIEQPVSIASLPTITPAVIAQEQISPIKEEETPAAEPVKVAKPANKSNSDSELRNIIVNGGDLKNKQQVKETKEPITLAHKEVSFTPVKFEPLTKRRIDLPVFDVPVVEKMDSKKVIGDIFKTEVKSKKPAKEQVVVSEVKVVRGKAPFKITKQQVITL